MKNPRKLLARGLVVWSCLAVYLALQPAHVIAGGLRMAKSGIAAMKRAAIDALLERNPTNGQVLSYTTVGGIGWATAAAEADTLDSVMERGLSGGTVLGSVAGNVAIAATGGSNDITLSAADDLLIIGDTMDMDDITPIVDCPRVEATAVIVGTGPTTDNVRLEINGAGRLDVQEGDDSALAINGMMAAKFVVGSADTSGSMLEVNSGTLTVREGDDSADAPFQSGVATVASITAAGGVDVATGRLVAGASAGSPDVGLQRPAAGRLRLTRGTAPSTWGDQEVRGLLSMGQWGYLCAHGQTGTLDGMGLFRAVAETGGGTNVSGPSTVGSYATLFTTVTITTVAGWAVSEALQGDNLPYYVVRWAPADIVDVRYFIGISSLGVAATLALDAPANEHVGISYSNDGAGVASRDDARWQWVESAGGAQTVTDTGVALGAAATVYWLEIDFVALDSIVLTLRNETWTSLATRTMTSSPFQAADDLYPVCGVSNLGAVDQKGVTTYQASVISRVGSP